MLHRICKRRDRHVHYRLIVFLFLDLLIVPYDGAEKPVEMAAMTKVTMITLILIDFLSGGNNLVQHKTDDWQHDEDNPEVHHNPAGNVFGVY
jgi:hypothetical protein